MRARTRQAACAAAVAALLIFADLIADAHSQPETPDAAIGRVFRTTDVRAAIGRDLQIAADEEVLDGVAVVGGSLRVDGRVRGGALVVGGDVHLGPQALVSGDLVLVGGQLYRDESARLHGSVNHVTVGTGPWWSSGVVRGWPLGSYEVRRWAGLAGTLVRVATLAVLMGLVLLIARGPVARVARAAAAEPGRAIAVGLVAELLFVPLLVIGSVALAITIVGLPLLLLLLPLAILTGVAAMLLGFTALSYQIGDWVRGRLGWRVGSAAVATAIGLLLIVGPTLLARTLGVAPEPLRYAAFAMLIAGMVVEFAAWTVGLGAALITRCGRRATVPPPVPNMVSAA